MQSYKTEFIEFMVQAKVLSFGDFVTKSGRKTPFFINTGRYDKGSQLRELGRFYARALVDRLGLEFDVLFGPAYKGIPLVVATAMALAEEHGKDVSFVFNRKEAKDHGEGGLLVGHKLADGERVVLIEDVTTAGTSVRETLPLLQAAAHVRIAGLLVSVDRMERGTSELNALAELELSLGAPAFAIVTIEDAVSALRQKIIDGKPALDDATYERVLAYRKEYGGKTA
ncbi:MAG: orotate phosphoribosyltransferase [Myxococcota bacterium]